MPVLTIEKFSCLKSAKIDLSSLNVLIGAQGSGKSVIAKLFYFCTDVPIRAFGQISKYRSIEAFKSVLSKEFCELFPPGAWGDHRFTIKYEFDNFFVRILRRQSSSGGLQEDVVVSFSQSFTDFYDQEYRLAIDADKREDGRLKRALPRVAVPFGPAVRGGFSLSRSAGSEYPEDQFVERFGGEIIKRQLFIPAGRSFFTSAGKIVASMDRASSIDAVTIKFARLYSELQDYQSRVVGRSRANVTLSRNQSFRDFLKGTIHFEDDTGFLKASDGRKIPFSALSSGQQELLPLLLFLESLDREYNDYSRYRSFIMQEKDISEEIKNKILFSDLNRIRSFLLYIEEPEAHLFPEYQARLTEYLITNFLKKVSGRRIFLTTHSPYILAQINLLLKAGEIGLNKQHAADVEKLIPSSAWLDSEEVSAWSIDDGTVASIMTDGLIDGSYIDSISSITGSKFDRMLDFD